MLIDVEHQQYAKYSNFMQIPKCGRYENFQPILFWISLSKKTNYSQPSDFVEKKVAMV